MTGHRLVSSPLRSTKAGARTPATLESSRTHQARASRSTKAGARTPATRRSSGPTIQVTGAQRRPGHAPRRHLTYPRQVRATRNAQRRPGHAPRRHLKSSKRAFVSSCRSTKAGARTPATRCRLPLVGQPQAARSTKAGARTPATPGRGGAVMTREHAQRRPGHAPRRHCAGLAGPTDGHPRSTKAGARTPATHPTPDPPDLPDVAQRRPGHAPRRHCP